MLFIRIVGRSDIMGYLDFFLVLAPLICITDGVGLPMWATVIVALIYYVIVLFSPPALGIVFTMLVWIGGIVSSVMIYRIEFTIGMVVLFTLHIFLTVKIFGKRRNRWE
jgi:hypothetical protein